MDSVSDGVAKSSSENSIGKSLAADARQIFFWSVGLTAKMKGHNIGNWRMATLRFYITQTINGQR